MDVVFVVVVVAAMVGMFFLRGFVALERRKREQIPDGISRSQMLGQRQHPSAVSDELAELADLRGRGIIDQHQFDAEKKRLS
jgi:hypothetical protein